MSFEIEAEMAYGVSRAILRQALRDFHSNDQGKRTDVAEWIGKDDYLLICESAEIDSDFFAMFFLEMSKRPLIERRSLAENAISALDSFHKEPPT